MNKEGNQLKYYHIVAVDNRGGIGIGNKLPWHNKADLEHFKSTTMGGVLLMGRKTYDSLPPTKLPGRHIVVLSKTMSGDMLPKDVHVARTLQSALLIAKDLAIDWCVNRVYIAGGAELYDQTASIIDGVMLSRIQDQYECDTRYKVSWLRYMTCVMNKSLEQREGEAAVEVHEYALVNLIQRE